MYLRCFDIIRFDKNTLLRGGLCLIWLAGFSLGYAADRFYGDTMNGCVLLSAAEPPSFSGCLSVNLLPLLISACAVFFFRSAVFPLGLFRGFLMGLSVGAVSGLYQEAALMMAVLLLFSGLLFAPVTLWYLCRRLERDRQSFFHDTILCGLIALAVAFADLWIVSPLLREIIIF